MRTRRFDVPAEIDDIDSSHWRAQLARHSIPGSTEASEVLVTLLEGPRARQSAAAYPDLTDPNVVLCVRTHMPDLGDGIDYSTTNWTRIDYAGNGLWWRQEDIYNPTNFATLLTDWQTARDAATNSRP